jgi:hypothetical protein
LPQALTRLVSQKRFAERQRSLFKSWQQSWSGALH